MLVLAGLAVAMLLLRLVLELWALCGHLSKRFEEFRQDYWIIFFTTIVRVVVIVYGTWALYCLYQFRAGDSWAASLLAALTLAVFTVLIGFFTLRIFYLAGKARSLEGGVDELYEHKPWMRKYGFFDHQFKSRLWWFFVPIIILSLVRAFLIVFGAGSGLVQAIGILAAEGIFLVILFWRRPYDGRGANVVNAMIAVVRVLSIICILIFVQELGKSVSVTKLISGISRTTQTILGVVLIAIQSTLTVVLAILIIISGIASCLHKRKPTPRNIRQSAGSDDDLRPLDIPLRENVSELDQYPSRRGYIPTATSEPGFQPEFADRRNSRNRDPFRNSTPTPIYEEYSSTYGSSRPHSVASRHPSVGYGRVASIGSEGDFQYRPIGSPPPAVK